MSDSENPLKFSFNLGVGTIISLLLLALTIFTTVKSCSRQEKLNTLNFQKLAEDYRPKLIPSNPVYLSVFMKVDTSMLKSFVNSYKQTAVNPVFAIPIRELKFKFSFWIKNEGNSQANLLISAMYDTVYQGRVIEKTIMNGFNTRFAEVQNDSDFADIDVGDSLLVSEKINVRNILRNKILIHFYCLYENQTRLLYSSYTWFEFELHPEKLLIIGKDSTDIKGIVSETQLKSDQLSYIGRYTNTSIIEPKDTSTIRKFITSLNKKLDKPEGSLK